MEKPACAMGTDLEYMLWESFGTEGGPVLRFDSSSSDLPPQNYPLGLCAGVPLCMKSFPLFTFPPQFVTIISEVKPAACVRQCLITTA